MMTVLGREGALFTLEESSLPNNRKKQEKSIQLAISNKVANQYGPAANKIANLVKRKGKRRKRHFCD